MSVLLLPGSITRTVFRDPHTHYTPFPLTTTTTTTTTHSAAEFRSAHQSYWTAEVAQAYKDALANLVIQPKATRGGGGGGASSRNSNSNNSSASTAEEGGMRGSQRSRGWWRMSGRRASLRGSIDGDAAGAGAGAGVGRDDIMVDMPDPSASAGDHGSSRRSSTDNVEVMQCSTAAPSLSCYLADPVPAFPFPPLPSSAGSNGHA